VELAGEELREALPQGLELAVAQDTLHHEETVFAEAAGGALAECREPREIVGHGEPRRTRLQQRHHSTDRAPRRISELPGTARAFVTPATSGRSMRRAAGQVPG